jgi:hypothetical protein
VAIATQAISCNIITTLKNEYRISSTQTCNSLAGLLRRSYLGKWKRFDGSHHIQPFVTMPTSLPDLPREIFDHITGDLAFIQKLNLSLTSKTMRCLMEPLLYSSVKFEDKDTFVNFAKAVTSKPHLRSLVKRLRLSGDDIVRTHPKLVKNAICIEEYSGLSHLEFMLVEPEPKRGRRQYVPQLLRSLIPGGALQSLTTRAWFALLSIFYTCADSQI